MDGMDEIGRMNELSECFLKLKEEEVTDQVPIAL